MRVLELSLYGETTSFHAPESKLLHTFVFGFRSLTRLSVKEFRINSSHFDNSFLLECCERGIHDLCINQLAVSTADTVDLSEESIIRYGISSTYRIS